MNRPKITIITGPTATGKTEFGVLLAAKTDGEIVSADSMQIYTHMDIGTAKPTQSVMMGIAHHMIGIVPPWEYYSAARYVADASACIGDILSRGKRPILVGGAGLYIDSLLSGRDFAAIGDQAVRRELEEAYDNEGGAAMLLRLREVDPLSAERLHSNDKKRIVRALEVCQIAGKTISEHDLETKSYPPRYDAQKIALTWRDRAELYRRIDMRVDSMLSGGLFDEVRGLLGMGLPPDSTAMQAIGYKEMALAVLGRCSVSDAADMIKMESRRYAKRQLSWLRRDPGIIWMYRDDAPDVAALVEKV